MKNRKEACEKESLKNKWLVFWEVQVGSRSKGVVGFDISFQMQWRGTERFLEGNILI